MKRGRVDGGGRFTGLTEGTQVKVKVTVKSRSNQVDSYASLYRKSPLRKNHAFIRAIRSVFFLALCLPNCDEDAPNHLQSR
jgi:hypothetical protein